MMHSLLLQVLSAHIAGSCVIGVAIVHAHQHRTPSFWYLTLVALLPVL